MCTINYLVENIVVDACSPVLVLVWNYSRSLCERCIWRVLTIILTFFSLRCRQYLAPLLASRQSETLCWIPSRIPRPLSSIHSSHPIPKMLPLPTLLLKLSMTTSICLTLFRWFTQPVQGTSTALESSSACTIKRLS